ncbi:MAG: hypothetical protein RJB61_2460, partial [Actinomycetota bacterium]
MRPYSFRRVAVAGALVAGLLVGIGGLATVSTAAPTAGGGPATDGTNQGKKPLRDETMAIVQLVGAPISTAASIDRGRNNR